MAFTRSGVRFPSPPFFCCTMVGNGGIVVWGGPGYFACPIVGNAGIAQLVEHNLAKVGVAGSSPVSRSGHRRHRLNRSVLIGEIRGIRRGVEQSGSSPGS